MISYELDGKVAVVTGGASGIGTACTHTLAGSEADVAGVGSGPRGRVQEYSDQAWHQVIRVNLDGVFFTDRAAIRASDGGDLAR